MPWNLGSLFGGSSPSYLANGAQPAATTRTLSASGLMTSLFELFGYHPPRYATDPTDNPNDDRPPVQ